MNIHDALDMRVLGTRRLAVRLIEAHPAPPDALDFTGVEVATSPFLDELRKAWPLAQMVNMNDDVAETWRVLNESRRRRG
jgi:hypothetical protein